MDHAASAILHGEFSGVLAHVHLAIDRIHQVLQDHLALRRTERKLIGPQHIISDDRLPFARQPANQAQHHFAPLPCRAVSIGAALPAASAI